MLRAVWRAVEGLDAAARTADALQELASALVPDLARKVWIFVVGSDGFLHAGVCAPADPGGGDPGGGAHDLDAGAILPLDAEHPAALAVRSREAAAVTRGPAGASPVNVLESEDGWTEGTYSAVALPLHQDEHVVGALLLSREGGQPYHGGDLDLLVDLGTRISLALENRRLRREVRAARRAKADFLAVMNHELRTPLTAVVGYADLLEAGIPGPVTEKQRRQLVRIKESAWDLLELIDGILGYARYEGERPELNIRQVEPRALIEDAIRVVEGAAEEKGLAISVETEDPLPSLPTDPEKARRVLFHLLSNAVKFTSRGEVRVRIRADVRWVEFSVIDTGVGIRPEEWAAIFEPFWQGERPETRTAGGAGMGLSLARKLIDLLSGEIEVDSEPGKGSTFVVRFPRDGPHPSFL